MAWTYAGGLFTYRISHTHTRTHARAHAYIYIYIYIYIYTYTVRFRFTTGLRSRVLGCKSERRKTSTI